MVKNRVLVHNANGEDRDPEHPILNGHDINIPTRDYASPSIYDFALDITRPTFTRARLK